MRICQPVHQKWDLLAKILRPAARAFRVKDQLKIIGQRWRMKNRYIFYDPC
jgi:hypothetical protein